MTFVFVFYMATNMVPANSDQFKIEIHNPKNTTETVTLDFTRDQAKRWKVVPSHKPKEVLHFKFDKQANVTIQDKSAEEKTYPLLREMEIKKDHKKWKKVTKVTFKKKAEDKEGKEKATYIAFTIEKSGKTKRTIQLDTTQKSPVMDFPAMTVIWK